MSQTIRHKPAAATAAIATFDAVGDVVHELDSIHCSYSAAPAAGNLKVDSPSGTTIWEVDVPAAGAYEFLFRNGLRGASGAAVIVTLASGGGTVQGILSATKV